MTSPTIVFISGANQGLGYETAKNLLLSDNYHIIISSRTLTKVNQAADKLLALPGNKGTVSTIELDVADDKSVDAAKAHIESKYDRIDVLVNNAGVYFLNREPVRDTLRDSLATNVVGAASLTEALLPMLRKSKDPRLVFVGSSMGSLEHNLDPNSPHGGTYASEYRITKTALNMMMVQYHMKLADIKVLGADPGFCATEIGNDSEAFRKMGAMEPHEGAEYIAAVARGDKDDQRGRVHGPKGVVVW
ncbi:uncharacterized protein LDX57_004377 [Aspergillus melleus]|uniref:uncharacterized protein n=1 Tax=Aspergillus melleus TaxID=138277 RepID=UPI001E8E43E5|nr:uncharacterized protein LDX57_004377 [Aspergillus melleus]KAH8426644.1 hypothetical protein LDX57_004377 [Aspergillus melleus]